MMYNTHLCWRYALVAYSSLLLVLTSAATLPKPVHLDVVRNGANNSASLGFDPEFQIYPHFAGGPPLDSNSLLMSTVQLMAHEAIENIRGTVPKTSWHSPDPRYASVGIFMRPAPQTDTMDRRMMMWGLEQSVRYMMEENRFESVRFRMMREGYDVGTIEYASLANNQQHQQLSPDTSTSRLEQRSTPVIASETNITSTLNAIGPQVFCRLCGYDLEAFDIFRPVVMMLREMAEFPARSHIGSYSTDTEVGVTALRFKDERRRVPPFFEVQWVVKACLAIPQYMLDKGTFSETDIRINVDGVLVAAGSLKIHRSPPPRYVRKKKKSMCVIS